MRIRQAVPSDAPGIARVHVDTWRTTYSGIMPAEVLAVLSYDRRAEDWRANLAQSNRAQFTYVAADGNGEIAAFVAAGPARDNVEGYTNEIYAIYVMKQYARRGIGRRLMSAAAQDLRMAGASSLMLWVLADNPARRFYERLGGLPILEKDFVIGGKTLLEVCYGWQNLDTLVDDYRTPLPAK